MKYLIGFAALCLAACSADTGSGPILIETTKIALYPDTPERLDVGVLEYRGGLVLSSGDERFGGLSGIEVEDNRVLMISDSAYWLTATLEFDDAGVLTDLTNAFYAPMLDADGLHLVDRAADAEGLASLGNGAYAVSFEREHRIDRYDIAPDWSGIAIATPTPLPVPPGMDRLRDNAGIEALVAAGWGYWAGIEYPIIDGRPHSLWRIQEDVEPYVIDYNAEAGFGVTGLTRFASNVIVLERFYARDIGNRIRIVGLDSGLDDLPSGNTAMIAQSYPDGLAELEPGMTIDNFEGIAVGSVNGEMRLFIVSDDNYNPGQRTLLLSFAFAE
ncbi:MAG: hypothetical protein DHS20C06_16500 [Hyphobacterium sp.]|nr:MAG: hypothetical protein DHS20C06_16500 [Hyphobacterium sp.]